MKLIINADDFGLTKNINRGIIEAYQHGCLTSTTLMANMQAFDHAVDLAKINRNLGVGVHLNLTAGKALIENSQLVDSNYNFLPLKKLLHHTLIDDIYAELDAQIKKVYCSGLVPTHLDSHHFSGNYDPISGIVVNLAKQYHLPIRRLNGKLARNLCGVAALEKIPDISQVKQTDLFVDRFYGKNAKISVFNDVCQKFYRCNIIAELMCHVGIVDDTLRKISRYHEEREKELEIIKSIQLKQLIKRYHIKLISYRDLL